MFSAAAARLQASLPRRVCAPIWFSAYLVLSHPLSLSRSPAAVQKAVRSRSHHHLHSCTDHNCDARSLTYHRKIDKDSEEGGYRHKQLASFPTPRHQPDWLGVSHLLRQTRASVCHLTCAQAHASSPNNPIIIRLILKPRAFCCKKENTSTPFDGVQHEEGFLRYLIKI